MVWKHPETWPARFRPALAGGRLSLESLRGVPVVLNFWASWCVPCKREAPRLVASWKANAGVRLLLGGAR